MDALTLIFTVIGVALIITGAVMTPSFIATTILSCGVLVLVGIIICLTALLYKFISGE